MFDVGAIVHFYAARKYDAGDPHAADLSRSNDVLAAIVTQSNGDGTVNLSVFLPSGSVVGRKDVMAISSGAVRDRPRDGSTSFCTEAVPSLVSGRKARNSERFFPGSVHLDHPVPVPEKSDEPEEPAKEKVDGGTDA